MDITLEKLVNRYELDQSLLIKHPEKKQYLENRLRETKDLIALCVLRNADKKEFMKRFIL